MKIKILKSCSGNTFSFKQGDVADVETYIGEDLVKCGFAESAEKAPGTPTAKTAPKAAPKTATSKKRKVSDNADA